MKKSFSDALTALWELAGEPTNDSLPISKSTFWDWKAGNAVPRNAEPLFKVVTALRTKANERRSAWVPGDQARYDQLTAKYLETLRELANRPEIVVLQRMRELTDQAVNDAATLQEPSARFPRGIRLEDLHVSRDLEVKVLESVPDNCAQLVVGEPGSGKTTILWSLYRALSESAGTEVLFIKATYLLDALRPDTRGLASALTVKEIMSGVNCCKAVGLTPVLLIDTLDQLMHNKDGRRLIASLLRKTQEAQVAVILSCRPGEAALLPFEKEDQDTNDQSPIGYHRPLRPLGSYSLEERTKAVRRHSRVFCPDSVYGPGAAQRLEDDIMGAVYQDLPLKEVCDNPLFLRLLFDVYAPEAPVEDVDVASLFDRLRDLRVERDGRAGQDRDSAERYVDRSLTATAQALARFMLAAQTLEFDTQSDWHHLETVLAGRSRDDIQIDLDQLSRRGIVSTIPGTATLRFFHQTFFEYMAAEYLRAAQRGRELVDRLLKYPDDLVLAAVAGQLIPREKPGRADDLLELLLNDDRTVPLGIEFYAQTTKTSRATKLAGLRLCTAAPEVTKRYLKLLPGRRHPDSDRWVTDLTTVWTATSAEGYPHARSVRFQLIATVHRLLHQHPAASIEFLDDHDRLGWLLTMEIYDLSGHKGRWLGLLSAIFRYDQTLALRWAADLSCRLLEVGKGDLVAELVEALAAEADRMSSPDDRRTTRRRILSVFEELLPDTASSEPDTGKVPEAAASTSDAEGSEPDTAGSAAEPRKKPAAVERVLGPLWASCQDTPSKDRLVELLIEAFTSDMEQPRHRARLRGASLLARRLGQHHAQKLVGHVLAASAGSARTALRYHVLGPALQASDTSPFHRLLIHAFRDTIRQLSLLEDRGHCEYPAQAWIITAITHSFPAPEVLLSLLPDDIPASAWFSPRQLASLFVPAVAAGHPGATTVMDEWSAGLDREGARLERRREIRSALGVAAAQHPTMLIHLVRDAVDTGKTSVLTAALDAAAQHGHPIPQDVTTQLDALVEYLSAKRGRDEQNELYRLYRALIEHFEWKPPAPAGIVQTLKSNTVGKPLHTAALNVTKTAVLASCWTYDEALPLMQHLMDLVDTGQVPARRKGDTSSVRHVLAIMASRFPAVDKTTARDTAVSALLDLVLPTEGSPSDFIAEDVTELGWLLQRIAVTDITAAAEWLAIVSPRLRAYTVQQENLTTHIAFRWTSLLEHLLTRLDLTESKRLLLSLLQGDLKLACKAVALYAALYETSLTVPPWWFRDLATNDEVAPIIQQLVTARLRFHARMRCGEAWPELLEKE
ncbi:ATP-binding protein [Microbispora amethystogenes]|uniref:ATP-binding protein n=1 Tax=Microbispora amethystogenes TaxID=1427754 RepID=UPI0033C6E7D4